MSSKVKNNEISVIIDYRESELLGFFQPKQPETPFIKTSKILPIIQNLEVGDILLQKELQPNQNELSENIHPSRLIIERKTVLDFESSFLDGRYRDQRSRLLKYCEINKAIMCYIIEGDLDKTRSISTDAIKKLLSRLVFHYKIPVFFTKNIHDTADLIGCWYEQMTENPDTFGLRTEQIQLSDSITINKKTNDYQQFLTSCLINCNGISVKIAQTIQQKYPTLEKLMLATEKDISELKQSNNRRIGDVVGSRLWTLLHPTV